MFVKVTFYHFWEVYHKELTFGLRTRIVDFTCPQLLFTTLSLATLFKVWFTGFTFSISLISSIISTLFAIWGVYSSLIFSLTEISLTTFSQKLWGFKWILQTLSFQDNCSEIFSRGAGFFFLELFEIRRDFERSLLLEMSSSEFEQSVMKEAREPTVSFPLESWISSTI